MERGQRPRMLLPGVVLLGLALLVSFAPVKPGAAEDYTIRPGDILKIVVWGHDDLSNDYPVTRDGYVPFPLVGPIRAQGLTPTQVAQILRDLLEKDYLVNPHVVVFIVVGNRLRT